MADRLVCSKCGKSKRDVEFFKMKNGDRCDMCKDCLTMHIDNRKPDTFMWILEKFDVPYIEKMWITQTNKIYMKDPKKFGPKSVIGTYIRIMNMSQYSEYTFADSDRLNFENEKNDREAEARRQAAGKNEEWIEELKHKYETGQISKAEYDTLSPETEALVDPNADFIQPVEVDEEAIRKELTDEDYKYLSLKWGILYKPSEWVAMETLYQKYVSEYDINVDREETLKKICKTSLKMDQALDVGDMQAFKSLSSVYDQLRKSAKFTEAQNKEEEVRELDSIGELVAFVEREGGIIPKFEDPIEYPKDKVDFTIKDMQNYVNRLVKEELGLTDIIESFIQKMEKQKTESLEDIMQNSFNEKKEEDESLSLEDSRSFMDFYEEEVMKEAMLLEEYGDSEFNNGA